MTLRDSIATHWTRPRELKRIASRDLPTYNEHVAQIAALADSSVPNEAQRQLSREYRAQCDAVHAARHELSVIRSRTWYGRSATRINYRVLHYSGNRLWLGFGYGYYGRIRWSWRGKL